MTYSNVANCCKTRSTQKRLEECFVLKTQNKTGLPVNARRNKGQPESCVVRGTSERQRQTIPTARETSEANPINLSGIIDYFGRRTRNGVSLQNEPRFLCLYIWLKVYNLKICILVCKFIYCFCPFRAKWYDYQ